jgi:uncharacterized membrane protein
MNHLLQWLWNKVIIKLYFCTVLEFDLDEVIITESHLLMVWKCIDMKEFVGFIIREYIILPPYIGIDLGIDHRVMIGILLGWNGF